MSEFFIGMMTGTSLDAIDAVLVDFSRLAQGEIKASHSAPLPPPLQDELRALAEPGDDEISRLHTADQTLARLYAKACDELLTQQHLSPKAIIAIGNHGQNIRHVPKGHTPFTMQIGNPHLLAYLTGITTVADFRPKDIFAGGVGAPLVPGYHQAAFSHQEITRVIINIGGIANLTYLPAKHLDQPIIGFDTGPGNCLADAWVNTHFQSPYDNQGAIAKQGCIHQELLRELCSDPYFQQKYPKSTGKEYFNLNWLEQYLARFPQIDAKDVLTTLMELTAKTICDALQFLPTAVDEIYLCGGGVHNDYLLSRLRAHLNDKLVGETARLGVNAQLVEAAAFAWLARQTLQNKPGNIPSVTGAKAPVILGAIYPA